jgi:hypothetical protein
MTDAGADGSGQDDVVSPNNSTPLVDAGADVQGSVGQTLVLSGFSASDPDGDSIRISWNVLNAPAGSTADVVQPDPALPDFTPQFTPDVPGTYILLVTVTDGSINATDRLDVTVCEAPVDTFPLPINNGTSLFSNTDDASLEISFSLGFSFEFFGVTHSSLHLNTNGGITFGAGNSEFDQAAAAIAQPTIAPFWGDHAADEAPGGDRPNQLSFQRCPDRFVVAYRQLQAFEEPTQNNSATVTLSSDGTVVLDYGEVLSSQILAGVFDGSHTDDRFPNPGGQTEAILSVYEAYSTTGTGTILVDHFGEAGLTHSGELSGRRITFRH